MTPPIDPVDEVLDAYFDYLEGIGEEPALDHLSDEQRAQAERLIASLNAAQGMEPEASRPSIAALIVRASERKEARAAEQLAESLEVDLQHLADPRARVTEDVAAQAAGLDSRLVVHLRGLRLRALVDSDGRDLDATYTAHVPAIAGVFGAFPDTNAVLLTSVGGTTVGAIVDRDDVVTAIETPSGEARPPRIRRPVTSPAEACLQYAAEVMPMFEPFDYVTTSAAVSSDVLDVETTVTAAIEEVVASGARARVTAKKSAWTSLGEREAVGIAAALRAAASGDFDTAEFSRQIDELVEVA